MTYTDSIFDRYMFSTETNEYATGLNDENEWEEELAEYGAQFDRMSDEDDDSFLDNGAPDHHRLHLALV
ncbi:MAG: hypothetical protein LBU97_00075 [Alistipes sp.]|jgi:hypothetical protein|nr:hypothetical protein [Alistipes sp.]